MTKKERELVYKLLRMLADKLSDTLVEEMEDIEKAEKEGKI